MASCKFGRTDRFNPSPKDGVKPESKSSLKRRIARLRRSRISAEPRRSEISSSMPFRHHLRIGSGMAPGKKYSSRQGSQGAQPASTHPALASPFWRGESRAPDKVYFVKSRRSFTATAGRRRNDRSRCNRSDRWYWPIRLPTEQRHGSIWDRQQPNAHRAPGEGSRRISALPHE